MSGRRILAVVSLVGALTVPAWVAAAPAAAAAVPTPSVYRQVAAGQEHSCALTASGGVWCWGLNESGRLGDGTTVDRRVPVPVQGLPAPATAVVAGYNHSCALLSTGGVSCWGGNVIGQLGDGTTTDSAVPVAVSGLSGVVSIDAANAHTCALLGSGGVRCWGSNDFGMLGDGTFDPSSVPVAVSGITDATAIAAGQTHSCAVVAGGAARCWGANGYGQLGDGTSFSSATPTTVFGLSGATAIDAGARHTCAVLGGGGVRCWGRNDDGQLGDGSTSGSSVPVEVTGLAGVRSVALGYDHSCAVGASGGLSCWGYGISGQLGTGETTSQLVPVAIGGTSGTTAVAGGYRHTCATRADGGVRCWGWNEAGQLGTGSADLTALIPADVAGFVGTAGNIGVSAGFDHTCARSDSEGIWCWGFNAAGELGDGSSTAASAPVRVPGLAGISQVASGLHHTCALRTAGTVTCWGANDTGQLGDGTTTTSKLPVAVAGVSGASAIAAGGGHTCALLAGGSVTCWGANPSGQLGNGSTTDSLAPVAVSNLTGATAISAGYAHTCAVVAGGGVRCWGYGGDGQLGNGATASASQPVTVTGLADVTAVAAGAQHTCARTSSGTASCWGGNGFGQLGNGSTTASSVPVAVSALTGVQAVAAGYAHSCAALGAGGVRCWGSNGFGNLGNGTTTDSSTPVTAPGMAGATAVTAGYGHSCAVASVGTRCWGRNTAGQLGNGSTTQSTGPAGVVRPAWAPTAVSASAGIGQATVSWTAPANAGFPAIAGYVVTPYIGTSPQASITFASTATTQTVTGLANGTSYSFAVAALSSKATGPQSAPSVAVTPSPTANLGFLRVVTSPAVPSQITVDGAIADSWGLKWVKQPAGSHTVCFSSVEGYTTPGCQTVTVTAGQTTTVTGSFVARGFLRVITSPAVNSQITVDGVPRNNWGLWTDVPVGAHEVCFGAVANFTAPPCQTVNLVAGTNPTVTGTFTPSSATGQTGLGFLRVVTSPARPSQITVDGNIANTWGLDWLQIAPGSHTVCFSHVEGWTAPGCSTVTVTADAITAVTGTFVQRGYLKIDTSPAVPGTITVDGVPADDWGDYTDRPVGTYEVCFGEVPGTTAPPCQDAVVTAGTTTEITGVYT